MKSTRHVQNRARWIAAAVGMSGFAGLVVILTGEGVELTPVFASSALLVVGTTLFVRMSLTERQWERTVNGPEARRFLAISLGISSLLLLAAVVVLVDWIVRGSGPGR